MFSEIFNLVIIFDYCKSDTVNSISNTDKSKIGSLNVFLVKKITFYFNENILVKINVLIKLLLDFVYFV